MSLRFVMSVAVAFVWVGSSPPVAARSPVQQASDVPVSSVSQQRETLDRYCVSCHNARLQTAGLALDEASLDAAGLSRERGTWERVVRKLELRAMPPVGRPRPDESTYEGMVAWLEQELDRVAADMPDPGNQPAVRRLTRTEYKNVIRDLLALESLPAEVDPSGLLPRDSSAAGFDNVADVLYVSPAALEGYLAAARKISRFAVGDPSLPAIIERHQMPFERPQDQHFSELPFGTRGGTALRTYVPLDAEYQLVIETERGMTQGSFALEVSVDGARAGLFPVDVTRPRRGAGSSTIGGDNTLEVTLPLRAGPRVLGVTFVDRPAAPEETVKRSFLRTRGRMANVVAVTLTGPVNASSSGDTPSRRQIFSCRPSSPAQEQPCAKEILSTLARRAYRRPVTEEDLAFLLPFYEAGWDEAGFERGVQYGIERLLVSPGFLFRVERDPADVPAGSLYQIADLELATRLSFFLWSSIPDDELLNVAVAGTLRDPEVLDQQVRRMLADRRAQGLVTNFASQWLYLRDLDAKRMNYEAFPNFDVGLKQAFMRETELFIESIIREDRSVLQLLTADYTFVNERLAKHYGIPHVYGDHFRRVELAGLPRRGLLGHGSILALTSRPTRTSPVLRGKWVLENILASPPPPPPPNVPALEDTDETGAVLSMRDRMVRHRANPVCASCHALMDPIGLSMENYDASGAWRTKSESGAPVDSSGVFLDGSEFEGADGLQQVLLGRSEIFVRTLSEKLLGYALGRNLGPSDPPTVRAIARAAEANDYRFSSLIGAIARSMPFQMRRSGQ